MQPLISHSELRGILEHGLLTGKWSVLQFNKKARDVVLPSKQFLEEHPEFQDMELRDMEAFRRHHYP
jgi:hypothetical protein